MGRISKVSKTLYIPLYGKVFVSRRGIILHDKKAEEIWAAEGFELKGKSKSKWLAYYMGMRSAVFDDWLKEKIADTADAVIIHIGCGMDDEIKGGRGLDVLGSSMVLLPRESAESCHFLLILLFFADFFGCI